MVSRLAIVLALGYLGALIWGLYEWRRPLPLPPEPEFAPESEIPTIGMPPAAIGSLDAFNELIERPLFTSTRRPQAIGDEAPATDEPQIDNSAQLAELRLTAIIIDGDHPTALVEHTDGTIDKLQVGGKLRSWEVSEITDDELVLIVDGTPHTLAVHRFDAPPPVAPQRNKPSVVDRRVRRTPSQRRTTRQAADRPARDTDEPAARRAGQRPARPTLRRDPRRSPPARVSDQ